MAHTMERRAERRARTFVDDERASWWVEEVEAARVPGARRATCLVFHCRDHWHRLWDYPENWAELPAAELAELSRRR